MINQQQIVRSFFSLSTTKIKVKKSTTKIPNKLKGKTHLLLDKNTFKKMVAWVQENYGEQATFLLLENLKSSGFSFATRAGLSLGIDDLRPFFEKKKLIDETQQDISFLEQSFIKQNVTPLEKSQYLITKWTQTSRNIIQRIANKFPNKEPLNPLAMMAFSGARGNISQVTQLIGLRGLMADPLGRLVEFPIQGNFREGMTLTEYFISCYGARKGLIDTALRTATAGYLTRRLVYIVQHIYISAKDCGTMNGEYYPLNLETNATLIGLTLLTNYYGDFFIPKHTILSPRIINKLRLTDQKKSNRFVICRSVFTCKLSQTVCQACYGWDHARAIRVDVGEAVGILAAQSIGEPGTQLTLRTFHTGGVGVLSGSSWTSYASPCSGIIHFKKPLLGKILRAWIVMPDNTLVRMAYRLKQPLEEEKPLLIISSPSNKRLYEKELTKEGLLFAREGELIKKGQLLFSEINIQNFIQSGLKAFVPFHSPEDGKIIILPRKKGFNLMDTLWLIGYNLIKFSLSFLGKKKSYKREEIFLPVPSSILIQKDLFSFNTPLFQIQLIKNQELSFYKTIEKPLYALLSSLDISTENLLDLSTWEVLHNTLKQTDQKLNLDLPKLIKKNTTKEIYALQGKPFLWNRSSYNIRLFNEFHYYYFNIAYINLYVYTCYNKIVWFFIKNKSHKKEKFPFFYNPSLKNIKNIRYSNFSVFLSRVKKNNKINYFNESENKKKKVIYLKFSKDINGRCNNFKTVRGFFHSFLDIEESHQYIKTIPTQLSGEFKRFSYKNNILFWSSIPLKYTYTFYKIKKDGTCYNPKFRFIRWGYEKENIPISGYVINKSLNTFTLQLGIPLILPSHTIYHKVNGDFIYKNELLCSFKTIKYETQDIVQGIPRIEKLLEGRPLLEYSPKIELTSIWLDYLYFLSLFALKEPVFSETSRYSSVYLKYLQYKYTGLSPGELCEASYLHAIVNFGYQLGATVTSVYAQEGVSLSFKHIALIIRELTSLVEVIQPGHSGFFKEEQIHWFIASQYNKKLRHLKLKEILFFPIILGMTERTRKNSSFGVAGSFQNLREALIKHTLAHKTDYLLGLHENLLFSKFIPSGTGFYSVKIN